MALRTSIKERLFNFNFRAKTSRGTMREKKAFFVVLSDDELAGIGIGEAGPLDKLSIDAVPEYEEKINFISDSFNGIDMPESEAGMYEMLDDLVAPEYPSVRFALETALLDLRNGGNRKIYENDFSAGQNSIKINGLIWMGDMEFMLTQITDKIDNGFNCIKIKVGSLDFEKECDIIDYVRRKYYKQEIVIRIDANGAFKVDTVDSKLDILSKFNIHSIEQPLPAGNLEKMHDLCINSPIPVGLDEELIGINVFEQKRDLVNYLKPAYLVLKPMLLGGFKATSEWIKIAEEFGIGWWITSALESNIGLNAICQFAGNYNNDLEQGLGTGQIYENNFESPLELVKSNIRLGSYNKWNLSELFEKKSL